MYVYTPDLLVISICTVHVCIEPNLQSRSGEVLQGASSNTQDGAHLDIAANGFWSEFYEIIFFDVRILNSHAPSHRHYSLATTYRKQEALKIHKLMNNSLVPSPFSPPTAKRVWQSEGKFLVQ